MSLRLRRSAPVFLTLATVLLEVSPSFAASWQSNVSYGANTRMDLYVPDEPATPAPIVVVLHYCGGNSGNAHGWLQSYADQHGFILITPQAGGNCFDASASRAGERANVAQMVEYVVENNDGDATRVFSVGASSGACMTQALLAAYPEVFAGGSSLAGVPAGAWTGGNVYGWSTSGTSGAQAWGDKVRNANPGYTGPRPRVQLWHGQGDTTLTYSDSYPQQVQQWTNVFGVTDADATMEMIKPMGAQDTWARTSYKDDSGTVVLEANSGPSNVPHDISGRGVWGDVVRFFGLDRLATGGAGGMGGTAGTGSGGNAGGGAAGTGTSGGGVGGGDTAGNGGIAGSGGVGMSGSGGIGMPAAGAGMGGGGGGGSGLAGAGTGGAPPGTGGTSAGVGGTSSSTGGKGGSTMSGSGGTSNAGRAGASTGTAGASSTAPNSGDRDSASADEGGCSIGSTRHANGLALTAFGLGALGLLVRRRRR